MSGFAFWCLGVFVGFAVLDVGLASLKTSHLRPAALTLLVLLFLGSSALLAAAGDRGVLAYPVGLLVAMGGVAIGPALLRLKRWRRHWLLALVAGTQLMLTAALTLGSAAYLVRPAIAEAQCQRPINCGASGSDTDSVKLAPPNSASEPK